jgi:hypothetical protein
MTTINTSNALGAKLLHYLPLNGTEGDIAAGQSYTLNSGGSFVNDPAYGTVLQGNGADAALWMGTFDNSSVNAITFAFRLYISADNDAGVAFEVGQPYESAWGGLQFMPQAGDGGMWFWANNNAGGGGGYHFPRPSVGWHDFIISVDGDAGTSYLKMTIDGVNVAPDSGSDGTTGNRGNNPLRLLYRTDTPIYADEGPMSTFMVFSGVLSDAERTSLHGDWNQVVTSDAPPATAPAFASAIADNLSGNGVYVDFDAAIFDWNADATKKPATSAFTVTGSVTGAHAFTGMSWDASIGKIRLYGTNAFEAGETITVSYAAPTDGTGVFDATGAAAVASFGPEPASNNVQAGGASGYAYRFHRLVVLATNGSYNNQWSAQELELRSAPGGVDLTTPTSPITASTENTQYGEVATNLLDNNPTGGNPYSSDFNYNAPHTLTIDLGFAQEVKELAIWPQVSTDTAMVTGRLPKDFDYLASDSATGPFVLLHSYRGFTGWNLGGVNTFDVSAQVATAVTVSGPTSGGIGDSQLFTLQANGALDADITVTVATSGTSNPSQDVVIAKGTGQATFYITTTSAGTTTLHFSSASSLAMPADQTYVSVTNLLRTWGSAGDDFPNLDAAIDWANTQDPAGSRMDVILEGSVMAATASKSLGNANSSSDYRFIIRPRADLRHNYNAATAALYPSMAGATLTLGNGSNLGLARGTVIEDYKLDLQSTGAIWNNRDYPELEPEFRRCIIRIGATDAINVSAWQKMIANDCLVYTDVAISRMINTAWDFSAYRSTFVVLPGGSCDSVMNQAWGGSNFEDSAFYNFNTTPVTGNVKNCYTGSMYGVMNGLQAVTAADMFVDINSNLRAGSALKGLGSQGSISTLDVLGNNRGLTPDVGAGQQVAATPLVVSEITSQPAVDGQTVVLSGTYSGTVVSATATLNPDADPNGAIMQGPTPLTYSAGAWNVTFDNVPPGNYARPQILFTNDGGSAAATGGGAFDVMGFNGVTLDPGTSTAATAVVRIAAPSSGTVGQQVTGFQYGLDGDFTGTVRITPNDAGAGGSFAPLYADITSGGIAEFSYTPAVAGNITISVMNDQQLNNPPYTTLAVQSATLPVPSIGIATSDLNVMAAARATLSGPFDYKGDPNGKIEVFADDQSSAKSLLLGSTADGKVNVNAGTWTGQFQNVPAGLWKFRARVTANSQPVSASTGIIRILDVSGSPRMPLP